MRDVSISFLSRFCVSKATDHNRGKNQKKPSNKPCTRKVINPTPLKQRFKGRYIFYLTWFCCEIPKAVTEVHISSSSSIKKECLHGLCQEEWKVQRKNKKEEKKNIPVFPQLFLKSQWSGTAEQYPGNLLLCKLTATLSPGLLIFRNLLLHPLFGCVLHLSLPWKKEHRREKEAVLFQAIHIKSLNFFLQNISSRIYWLSCRCSKVWAQHLFFPAPHLTTHLYFQI